MNLSNDQEKVLDEIEKIEHKIISVCRGERYLTVAAALASQLATTLENMCKREGAPPKTKQIVEDCEELVAAFVQGGADSLARLRKRVN